MSLLCPGTIRGQTDAVKCNSRNGLAVSIPAPYSAAYAGCYKGITGREVGGDLASQFPEPKLRRYVMRIYHAAVADCSYTP